MPINPWTFVGASTVVETTATGHTLTLPAGTAQGDLLVAVISSRIASTTAITLPSGWTLVTQQRTNNVVAGASTGIASCMMAYIVRGASAPALGFTHPVAPSVAQGQIVAYRGNHPGNATVPTLEASTAFTTATGITAVSGAGLTTIDQYDLLVMGVAGGRAAAWSNFDAVTRPSTGSGTGGQTGAPIVGTWQERADTTTTTGADTSLGIADGIVDIGSATGNLSCTASLSGGHAVCAGAFRVGYGEIQQAGSTLTFPNLGNGITGTVSTTITVPADAQMVVAGFSSYSSANDNFTNMTFTKGGVDTQMIPVGNSNSGAWGGGMFYLMLPDTGANKTLKWSWANAPGDANTLCSVTFWKGLDLTAPVATTAWQWNGGAPFSATWETNDGNMVLMFAAAFSTSSAAEGSVVQWVNGSHLEEITHYLNADASWGRAYPGTGTGTIGVNTETNWDDGSCWMLELRPASKSVGTSTITQCGGFETWPAANTNTGTITGVDVPPDAELIIVGVSGRSTTVANYFSGGGMTFTKGGVDTAMTAVSGGDASTGSAYAAMFYLALPDKGLNKTLKWDWAGATAADTAPKISVTYWKGVDTAAPVRNAQGAQRNPYATITTPTLTAQTGDLIVAWAGWNGGGVEGDITAWSNLTELDELGFYLAADAAWAVGLPTGNTTVGVTSGNNIAHGGLCAVVLKAPVAGVTGTLTEQEDPDVAALTGTVRWSATMAETEDPDVLAAAGVVRWAATLAETDDPDVAALTGSVRWAATLATTEAVDVAAMTGAVAWIATLAAPEAADVAALTGAVGWAATLATTEAPDVAALTGTVKDPISATLTELEDPDVAAFTGTVRWIANLAAVETVDVAAFLGTTSWQATLATTEAPDVAAFTGNVFTQVTGTFGTTEAPDVAAFNGTVGAVGITGTLDTVEPADVAAFTGGIYGTGTLATTEALDVAALTGAVRWTGTLATTEALDSGALTGSVRWAATLTPTETPDVGAFLGAVRWTATLAAGELPDQAAFTGGIYATGPLSTSEAPDVGAFTGATGALAATGTLAAGELPDQAAFTGGIYATGTLAVGELADVGAFTGTVRWLGTLAATEAPDVYAGTVNVFGAGVNGNLATVEPVDVAAFTGQVTGVAGTLATVEAPDAAALTAAVRWAATLATVESPDTAALTGTVQRIATLAAVEAPDVGAFTGTTRWTAALASSEAPDVAAFTGATGALAESATLAATEAPDVLAFTGTTTNQVVLDAREAPDDATIIVTFRSFGPLDATEAPDTMVFTEAPVSIQESPGYILSRDQTRVRSLANGNERVRSLKYPIPRPRELVNSSDQRMRELSGRRTRVLVRD